MMFLTGAEMCNNCRLWAHQLTSDIVYILATYKLIWSKLFVVSTGTLNYESAISNMALSMSIFSPALLPPLPHIPKFFCSNCHISICGTKWTENMGTRNPLAGLDSAKKCWVLPYLSCGQVLGPLLISAPIKVSDFKFDKPCIRVVPHQKQISGPKLTGYW